MQNKRLCTKSNTCRAFYDDAPILREYNAIVIVLLFSVNKFYNLLTIDFFANMPNLSAY